MFLKSALLSLVLISSQAAWGLHAEKSVSLIGGENWQTVEVDLTQIAKLDVLFVIDDSGSMGLYQQQLAVAAPQMAQFLATYADVNAGVVTSSMANYNYKLPSGGHLIAPPVNSLQSDFVPKLSSAVQVGTSGDATEKPLETLFNAVSAPYLTTSNVGLIRSEADLMVVILTDTDDQGAIKPIDVADRLRALKPNNTIHTLASYADNTTCIGENFNIGNIDSFVTDINGVRFNLCGDLVTTFTSLLPATNFAALKKINITPSNGGTVDVSSIVVHLGVTKLISGDAQFGWTYDAANNVVLIGDQVSFGTNTKITVEYKLL